MRFLQIALMIVFCGLTTNIFSQSVKNKAAKFDDYIYPQIPVKGIQKVKMTVYANNELDLSQKDLFEKKGLGKKLQAKQDQINNIGANWVTFQNYELVENGEDVNIELAFGNFEPLDKILKDHKIVCVRDDGKLDKDDLQECPAYYYQVSYNLPIVIRVSDKIGNILSMEHIDNQGSATFGYDESGLSGYIRPNELEEAYAKPTAIQKIKKDAIQDRLKESGEILQGLFYFQEVKAKIDIASGGGKLDYTDLSQAQAMAIEALEDLHNTSAPDKINQAIEIWNKALVDVDMNNKKARINRKLAGFVALNKTKAYYYIGDYENAMVSADESAKYLKFSTNTAHMETVNTWKQSINNAIENASASAANKSLVTGESSKAPELIDLIKVKEKNAPYQIIEFFDKYSIYKSEYLARQETTKPESTQELTDNETELANLLTGGSMTESGEIDWESRMQHVSNMGYYVNIAYSSQESVPTGICELEPLNTLLANNAKISSVPQEIGQLKNLKTLNLSSNSISTIPEEIGQLENLKKLNLSKNQLTSLPSSLSNCKNLKSLMLKGNSIPQSAIDKIQAALPNCKIKI